MIHSLCKILSLVVLVSRFVPAADHVNHDSLRLTIPHEFYAMPEVEMAIYFDNIVLTESLQEFRFEVACDVGHTDPDRWFVTAKPDDVGNHDLTIRIRDRDGKQVAAGSTVLRVISADAGTGRYIRLLIIGDSLTHASLYPNEIARLLAQTPKLSWTMLGTHRPPQADQGVAHEGYGGWTWQRFVSKYEPNPDGTYRKRSSPFVFLSAEKNPQLDMRRYISEHCAGNAPDFVIIMLGINDCFSASADNPDPRIDALMEQADVLLKALRDAAPKAEIGICLTTPPNARDDAFDANYQGRYPRWPWKRIQHRLVARQIQRFGESEDEHVSIIPTQLNLDPVDGYPANNAVHPNATGYKQIAASIHAWLMANVQ